MGVILDLPNVVENMTRTLVSEPGLSDGISYPVARRVSARRVPTSARTLVLATAAAYSYSCNPIPSYSCCHIEMRPSDRYKSLPTDVDRTWAYLCRCRTLSSASREAACAFPPPRRYSHTHSLSSSDSNSAARLQGTLDRHYTWAGRRCRWAGYLLYLFVK